MRGERRSIEYFCDWLGRKINRGNFFGDDAVGFGLAKGDFYDGAQRKFLIRRIGEDGAVFTKKSNWNYLVEHKIIIP